MAFGHTKIAGPKRGVKFTSLFSPDKENNFSANWILVFMWRV